MQSTTTPVTKTAIGKTTLHLLLVVLAYALTYLITYFGKIHWPNTMPVYLPGFLLVAVVALHNFVDKELPNFPTSQQLVAIPKEVAEALHIISVVNTDVLPEADNLLPENPTTAKIEKDAALVGQETQAVVSKVNAAVNGQGAPSPLQVQNPAPPKQ